MAADFSIRLGLVGASQVVTGLRHVIDMAAMLISKVRGAADAVMQYSQAVEGHVVSVAAADRATRGLIDSMKLHQVAGRLEMAGIDVTAEQMRALAAAATTMAQQTGQDATQAFDQLAVAVTTGATEALRRYGVSLEGVVGEQARVESALAQVTGQFGDTTIEITRVGEAAYALENAWGTMWLEMGRTLDRQGGAIVELLNDVAIEINDVSNALATASDAARAFADEPTAESMREIDERANLLGVDMQTLSVRMDAMSMATRAVTLQSDLLTAAWNDGLAGVFEQMSDHLDEARGGARGLADEYDSLQDSINELARAQRSWTMTPSGEAPDVVAPPSVKAKPGGRGGRRGGSSRSAAMSPDAMMYEMETLAIQARYEAGQELEQQLTDMIELSQRNADILRESAELERESLKLSAEMAENIARQEAEDLLAESLERQNDALRNQNKLQEERSKHEKASITLAKGFGQALGIVGTITEEVAGKQSAAAKIAKIAQGGYLVAYNSVMAITEAAKAISSSPDPVGMAIHAAGAIAHTAAAVEAGIQLGSDAGGPKTTSAATAPSGMVSAPQQRSARPEWSLIDDQRGGSAGGSTTIVNFNGAMTSNRAREELRRLESESARESI